MRAVSPRATALQATTTGTVDGSMVKMDPNRICGVVPLMAWVVVSRYRKRAAHPVAAPSTMPVATSRPWYVLHANGVHAQCAQDAAGQKAGQRAESEQQRARAPGRGDVRQGVPGEGLAADDGEDPDGGGDDGDHAPDDDGGVHRRAGEEPRLEKPPHAAQRPSCKGSIGMTAPASWPGPATTMTRPWTLRTST